MKEFRICPSYPSPGGSGSYMKVIGSRSRSQDRRRSTTGTHTMDACVSGQICFRAV